MQTETCRASQFFLMDGPKRKASFSHALHTTVRTKFIKFLLEFSVETATVTEVKR